MDDISEESYLDSDESQDSILLSPVDSDVSNILDLSTDSDTSQNNSVEPSMDSNGSIVSEEETIEPYSPATPILPELSDSLEFIEQDVNVQDEISEHDTNSSQSGPAHNTRTRSHLDATAQRQLETEQDSRSTVAGDTIEESSRTSIPRDELGTDVGEPPAKVRKLSSPILNDDVNDGETCPICLDSWGNSGDHRLVALKCGHLFGSKCVERWIRGKNSKERCCPTCKTKASVKDIRCIYAKRLVAVDTTVLTELQSQVQAAQVEKNQIQLELQTTKLEHRSMALQLELLRKTLATNGGGKPLPKRNWRFALDKNLDIWRDGGCRVLAYNCRTYEFYVSQKTTNNLFPGYGVRPISCVDYKLGPFIPLHPKAIRDVAYSQPTDLIMSVGLDGAVKIVERGIPTKTFQSGTPLWSCAWDHARPNHFYIGGVGGTIMSYDVRNTNAIMDMVTTPGDMSPCVSLVSTEFGLLSCQLNSSWIWSKGTLAGAEPEPIPLKGAFVSLCYDQESKRVGISCRPSNNERAKVALFRVSKSSDKVYFDALDTMYGSTRSTVMSRSAFVKCADSAWVAAYSESDSSLLLHPIDGSRTMTLPAAEATLDVCAGQVNGETVLAALSDSRLRLYKSYPTNYYS